MEQVNWANPIKMFKSVKAVTNGVTTEHVRDGKFVEECEACRGDAEIGDSCIACNKTYCRKCIMGWLEKYNQIWMVCDGNICEKCYLKQ